MVFENSTVIFLHILVLELLFDRTNIDVMMLFKFDFNHAILNFKTIASMKFSFDLNHIMIWSRDYVLFKWNIKNSYQKNLKNSVSHVSTNLEFLLIDRMFQSIDRTGIENRSSHLETSWWISSIIRLIENSFWSIGCFFQSIEQESRINQVIQRLQNWFIKYFNRSRNTFDRSNELFLKFH